MLASILLPDDLAIRVLVVERHALIGKAIAFYLGQQQGINVVGDARLLTASQLGRVRPDVVVLGVDHAGHDIAENISAARTVLPNVRVIVLSTFASPEILRRSLASGADGFVVKDALPQELGTAVSSVGIGTPYVDARVAATMLQRPADSQDAAQQLTPREIDIVKLIASGSSNRSIGETLHLSEKTIKNHVSRILAKLNFTARTQAAIYAIRTGIV